MLLPDPPDRKTVVLNVADAVITPGPDFTVERRAFTVADATRLATEDHAAPQAPDSDPAPLPRAEFTDAPITARFMTAGDAIVTFQSARTDVHFTYHIKGVPAGGKGPVSHFVHVLTGPDHYEYLGCIYESATYRLGRKSRIAPDAPSAKAFAWVWARLTRGLMPVDLRVFHEGRCGKCGRRLTTPESVASGLGPVCGGRS